MKKPSILNPTSSCLPPATDAWIQGKSLAAPLKLHSPRLALAVGVVLAAWAVAPHQAAAAVVINDTFGDGNVGTNTDGTGSGFTLVNLGTNSGTGSAAEAGGQVTVTAATGTNNTVGIASNNTLTVTATDILTITWDIAGGTGVSVNGITLGVRKNTDPANFFTPSYFAMQFRESASPTNTLRVQVAPGGATTDFGTGTLVTSQGYDGFTLTLVADVSGWNITSTSYASLEALEPISGGYGTSDFVTVFNGGVVGAYVQRGSASPATLTLNGITADVSAIPEPSTFGLAALGLLGLHRRRRV